MPPRLSNSHAGTFPAAQNRSILVKKNFLEAGMDQFRARKTFERPVRINSARQKLFGSQNGCILPSQNFLPPRIDCNTRTKTFWGSELIQSGEEKIPEVLNGLGPALEKFPEAPKHLLPRPGLRAFGYFCASANGHVTRERFTWLFGVERWRNSGSIVCPNVGGRSRS
jgi:hypothetical protein